MMNAELKDAIAPLLQALAEYEQVCQESIANSYHAPYSLSAFVPIDANDLRRLRDAVAGDRPIESTADICGMSIEV